MSHELVISVLCPEQAELVPDLTRAITESGCSISDCRVVRLGQFQSVLLRVAGPWHALAKLDDQLPKIQQRHQVPHLVVERGGDAAVSDDLVPYAVDAVCPDRPGVVAELAGFFAARSIGVLELNTQTYSAHQTGTAMFSVQISLGVPTQVHIPALREEFMDLCDRLNLDAVLEPIKT
jgi:glycine cleavage system transcriptional repressor